MGPNNGENQSGGVATLEQPAQVSSTTSSTEGNGLFPQPGVAAAPEVGATMPSVGATEAQPAAGADVEAGAPTTDAASATMPEVPGTEAKPLDAMNPLANSPLGAPDVPTLQATRDTFVSEKAAAQGAPVKPGMVHRVLGALGLRASAKTETVGQPANAFPDHLKDGVTPQMPNVSAEAAAAVNADAPKLTLSSSEMDAAMKQGAEEGKAILEPAPETTTPTLDTTLGTGMDAPKPANETGMDSSASAPTGDVLAQAEDVAAKAEQGADQTDATAAADEIIKNASAVSGAMDEIDKAASNAWGGTEPTDAAKPADGATSSTVDSASSWPSTPAAEPTTSGPAATPPAPAAAPTISEYHPTDAMTPAGEAAAPTTPPTASPEPAPAAPTNWSVDATASHPDAPVVEATSPDSKTLDAVPPFDANALADKPVTTDMPPTMASPDPAGLNLETTATPLAGTEKSTEAPFGTGMPPVDSTAAAESTIGASVPVEPETPTPTVPETPPEPVMASPSMGEQPVASAPATETPDQTAGLGGYGVAAAPESNSVAGNATDTNSGDTDSGAGTPPAPDTA